MDHSIGEFWEGEVKFRDEYLWVQAIYVMALDSEGTKLIPYVADFMAYTKDDHVINSGLILRRNIEITIEEEQDKEF